MQFRDEHQNRRMGRSIVKNDNKNSHKSLMSFIQDSNKADSDKEKEGDLSSKINIRDNKESTSTKVSRARKSSLNGEVFR